MENVNFQNVLDFPQDVWTLIFEKFLDKPPGQLNNTRLACSTFTKIIDSIPQRKFQQILSLVAPSLKKQDKLTMRLVSKYCKIGIDMIFENIHGEPRREEIMLRSFDSVEMMVENTVEYRRNELMIRPFMSIEKLQDFYETFKASHSAWCNPFPGRSIQVLDEIGYDDDDDDDYDGSHIKTLNELIPIVGRWGSHLTTIIIWTSCVLKYQREFSTLKLILNLMPNIRDLELKLVRIHPCVTKIFTVERTEVTKLEHLKKFTITYEYPWEAEFAFKMVKKHRKTLENVTIEGFDENTSASTIVSPVEFPVMTRFHFKVGELMLTEAIFENWSMPKLTRLLLKLDFDDFDDNSPPQDFDQTMKIITSSVRETLKFLCMYNDVEYVVITKEHLDFPLLKDLVLHGVYTEPTAVVKLPSLKTISLSFKGYDKFIQSDDVYLKTMWTSCPTLETIQFEFGTQGDRRKKTFSRAK